MKWLRKIQESLKTSDGKEVEVWEFHHQQDEKVLSEWAKHFRNHYCSDSQIDYLRKGYSSSLKECSRTEYLNRIKFPDPKHPLGPSIRAGDFGEILVADFLEYLLGYWVPRTRYINKESQNESTKGVDIMGFHVVKDGNNSSKDKLAIFEVKTQFSRKATKSRLQDAVDGSKKDYERKATSLNALRQRFLDRNELEVADKIARFQSNVDYPYEEVYGAVALFENQLFDSHQASSTDASSHPHSPGLMLIVIKGENMMPLVHELYRRAADEA